MKLIEQIRGLNPLRYKKQIFFTVACLATIGFIWHWTSMGADEYVTTSPSLTQRFSGVMSEKMLLDFCYQVRSIQGITGVSYRDYQPGQRTAMITVFYNPRVTSQRQIKIFLEHASILWVVPKAT